MNKKSIVKAISQKNNSLLIEIGGQEEWIPIGNKVDLRYVKTGEAEVSIFQNEFGKEVTFIKMIKSGGSGGSNGPNQEPEIKTVNPNNAFKEDYDIQNDAIRRMSALKASALIYGNTGKVEDFKILTEEIERYIKDGKWV